LTNKNKRVSVVRRGGPALFASVYRDFMSILQDLELYDYIKHNKSSGTFTFPNGCAVQFFSIDDQQKLRGRKSDLVFVNEANEITKEEFLQLNMRTTGKLILDYNPSDPYSWVIELKDDPKAVLIHSTYKDNPFLEEEIVREIENLINSDEKYYQIYALGILPISRENVFQDFSQTEFPEDVQFIYGLDFGFVDPNALVKVAIKDGNLYIKEEIYESYLTTEELIERMNQMGIRNDVEIVADSARPDIIQTLNNAGFYVTKGNKAIKEGLDKMRINKIHIDPNSNNAIREFRNYSYRKVHDRITETPIDFMNHTIDAARYATMKLSQGFGISVMI
jgi:phage terminase large subunit